MASDDFERDPAGDESQKTSTQLLTVGQAGPAAFPARRLHNRRKISLGCLFSILLCFLPHPVEILAVARLGLGEPALRLLRVLWNALAVEVQSADIHHRDTVT